ncbi:putative RNA-directed DNA polymerase from transposon BS [Takifugu flavidus]|uniref:Putative RNA-directed DNA polymerase from transposon BS n=1 Tax=Takifugu flavidus TaxID=433684 RepID=A0A5C6MPU5_9TELE|nr:putative RNA-directed DNA polymerase from transposon BS [Takifugu flavidus]
MTSLSDIWSSLQSLSLGFASPSCTDSHQFSIVWSLRSFALSTSLFRFNSGADDSFIGVDMVKQANILRPYPSQRSSWFRRSCLLASGEEGLGDPTDCTGSCPPINLQLASSILFKSHRSHIAVDFIISLPPLDRNTTILTVEEEVAVPSEQANRHHCKNKEELKTVQRELRRKIRQEKDNYRRKMENQLQQNNICGVWKGLKTISGFKEQKSQPVAQSPLLLPPPLSVPAIHCSSCPPSPSLMNFSPYIPDTSHPGPCPSPPLTPPCSSLSLTPHQVRKALKKNMARKATGPDGISSRLLKSCADQLCGIFSHMFNLSLKLGRCRKTPHPKELNSYGPVALTSHLMKTLERLILDHLRPLVSSFMDPLQFAYQQSIGVDDAVIYLLHTSLTHLEMAGSTVRIMFFDFSSAFNTIQPRLLGDKLQVAGVDHHLTTWILDYLTQRPQFLRVKGSESDRLLCSTGVPQGTVLAPFLFTLYTADFSYITSSCHLQKFSDDSAAVGLITDGNDTGQNNPPPAPVNILGTDVDVVESYKYLGVHLNNNLDWSHNTDALVKKGNSRLFLVRRLRSFGVQGPLLRTFYDSVVGSAIFYGIVCWSSSITDRDRKRMDRLVRRASSVLGCPLDSVEVVGNGRMMAKLSSMLNNTSHPLQDTLAALGSSFSERLLHPRCVKERYRRSFLPAAVRLHNKHNTR